MSKVEIYTRPGCGYCSMAKRLLGSKGVAYEETDIGREPDRKGEMVQRAKGRATFPQIFIDDEHVGGFDDMAALDRSGRLDAMLGR